MGRSKTISDEELLARCREGFLETGLGVSTKRLAAHAGISEGVLFQRFGSKDELFFACMRLPPPDLEGALGDALALPELPAAVERLGLAILGYLREQMPAVLLALAHPVSRTPEGGAQANALLADARGTGTTLHRLLREHPRAAALEGRDAEALVTVLVSTLLTRSLHEQIGVSQRSGAEAWLRRIVAALI